MRRCSPLLALLMACNPDAGLTKHNNDPVARILSHASGDSVDEGAEFTVVGSVSDTNHAASELVASWLVAGVERCPEAPVAEDGSTSCALTLAVGEGEVALVGRDPANAVGEAKVELNIRETDAPVAEISSPEDGSRFYANETVNVVAMVSDGEEAANSLAIEWRDQDGAVVEVDGSADAEGMLQGDLSLPEGSYSLTLLAQDSSGKSGSDTVRFEVGPENQAPSCSISAPWDGEVLSTGLPVSLSGLVMDPDVESSLLWAQFQSDLDGLLLEGAPEDSGAFGGEVESLSVGQHSLTLEAFDELGLSCLASVQVMVGQGPEITVESPEDGAVLGQGELLSLVLLLSDDLSAPEELTVLVESDLDGLLDSSSPDATGLYILETAELSAGEHRLWISATDTDGFSAEVELVVVVNSAPSQPTVEILPADPGTGDDLVATLTLASSDAEGDAVAYSYTWLRDGVLTSHSSDTVPASDTARGELWTVEVVPDDGVSEGPAAVATALIGNTAPVLSSLSLSPDPAREGDLLVCAAGSSSDADGDIATLSYAWFVNSVQVAASTSSLGSTYWSRGDSVSCVVTPGDGWEEGVALSAGPVSVVNSAPTGLAAVISPSAPTPGQSLSCSLSGYADADGDADQSTIRWTLNGAASGSGPTWSGLSSSGDLIGCAIQLYDGYDLGAELSTSVEVGNTPPVLSSVSLSPASPVEASILTCTPGTTTDVDGTTSFTYTYAWEVNGAAVSATTSTLTGADFDRGDSVRCLVTPSDGSSSGAAVASSAVTIGNTAPVGISVVLSPISPVEGDSLTAAATGSDVDGDAVSFTYSWLVNGVEVGTTGSTLSSAWFGRGDEVVARATPRDDLAAGSPIDSAPVEVGNSAPSITGAAISPDPAAAADTLSCTGLGYSDPDGDPAVYTYAWTIDGASAGSGSTLSGGFVHGDVVACTLTPGDGTDIGVASTDTITIGNTAPVVASVSLTPASPVEASTMTCTPGTTTDPDGTSSFTYTYSWTVNSSTVAATASTLTGDWFSKGDTIRCFVSASDGLSTGSSTGSATRTVGNTGPTMTSVTLSPSTVYTDDTITATAVGADVDGDTVSYSYAWTVNGSAVAATGSTLAGSYFNKGQAVVVSVTPTDGSSSGTALASSSLTVQNSAPSISGASISPAGPEVGDTLTCSASGGTDADGDSLSYTYAWTVDGAAAGTGSTLSAGFAGGDVVSCAVFPSDGSAMGSAQSASVTIGNSAPVVASVSISPSTATEASTLTCTPGTTTDADGSTSFTYTYAWTVNGSAIAPTSSTLTGTYFGKGDSVRCLVAASDGTSLGAATSSAALVISNTAPVASSVSLSPASVYTSDTITASASGTDVDGDTVSFTYAWVVNGSAVAATGSTLSGSYFDKGQTVYVRVTPTDGSDSGSALSSSSLTVLNSAPSITGASISPSTAYAGNTLTCSASGYSDADGDSAAYTYAWTVDGVAAGTGSTLSSGFAGGDVVACSVTPGDGSTTGTARSTSLTISNSTPVVSSVALSPTSAYEASTMSCTPTASDADGTSLSYTYRWYVNGSLVAPTSSSLTGTYFSKGNTVYCTVAASDGSATSSATSSNTVTIGNTAPSMTAVSLSPTSPVEASTITATPTSSDADGDTVSYTYAWVVNGSTIAATSSTLTGTYFSKGNTVYARVTPSDGSSSGTALSSSTVTIGNTAPTAPTVSIDPTNPEEAESLLCSITTASSDVDGDSLSYTISWKLDGLPYTGTVSTTTRTGDTVPGAAVLGGDVWTCQVTASDGSSSSSAGTDEVEVLGPSYTVGWTTALGSPSTLGEATGYYFVQSFTLSSAADLYAIGTITFASYGNQEKMAVYGPSSTLAGAPLVAYTATFVPVTGVQEQDVVGGPVSLAAGTYHLAWMCGTLNCRTQYSTSGGTGVYYKSGAIIANDWPTTYPSGSSVLSGYRHNFYMVLR